MALKFEPTLIILVWMQKLDRFSFFFEKQDPINHSSYRIFKMDYLQGLKNWPFKYENFRPKIIILIYLPPIFLFPESWVMHTNKLIKPTNVGSHFLGWIFGVVPFNTWLISGWEENKYCCKLRKCTEWHLFHTRR